MNDVDGLYKYAGTEVRWDAHGIDIRRPGARGDDPVRVAWSRISGARSLGEDSPLVQVLLTGREPGSPPDEDPFSFRVHSAADAARMVTQFSWYAGVGYPVDPQLLPDDDSIEHRHEARDA